MTNVIDGEFDFLELGDVDARYVGESRLFIGQGALGKSVYMGHIDDVVFGFAEAGCIEGNSGELKRLVPEIDDLDSSSELVVFATENMNAPAARRLIIASALDQYFRDLS